MIDATYFRENFQDQLKRMGHHPTVILHLFDGTELLLFTTEGIEEGYIMVQAYAEGSRPETGELPLERVGPKGGRQFAIPYEAISRVEFTLESQEHNQLGFSSHPEAASAT